MTNALKCAEELLTRSEKYTYDSTHLEKIFMVSELKAVRLVLNKPVLDQFVEELALSMKI